MRGSLMARSPHTRWALFALRARRRERLPSDRPLGDCRWGAVLPSSRAGRTFTRVPANKHSSNRRWGTDRGAPEGDARLRAAACSRDVGRVGCPGHRHGRFDSKRPRVALESGTSRPSRGCICRHRAFRSSASLPPAARSPLFAVPFARWVRSLRSGSCSAAVQRGVSDLSGIVRLEVAEMVGLDGSTTARRHHNAGAAASCTE